MLTKLKQEFEFGKREELNDNKKITYCGGDLRRDGNKILVSYDSYLKKICPITIPKGRDNKEKLTDQEKKKCRGLLALQWPGGQGMPAVCASTSLLAGELAQGSGDVVQGLKKCLRFAKERFWRETRLVIIGYIIVLTDKRVLRGEKCKFCTVAWRSLQELTIS